VLVFWLALGVALGSFVAGLAYAVVQGLRGWRNLKATGSRISGQLDEVTQATTQIEMHLDRASASSTRLTVALERLARSRARLDVLRAALDEARATVARAVPFLPPR
jgi:chromosome segregation ATPase